MGTESFRELFKYHIRENGYTNYEFAQVTGIDRVNIQRYLSGKRVPSWSTFDTILSHLRLSNREKEDFIESYKIISVGENLYYQRKYIKNMLEAASFAQSFQEQRIIFPTIQGEGSGTIQGSLAIERFMGAAVASELQGREQPFLYLFIPASNYRVENLLPALPQCAGEGSKSLSLIQLVELTKRTDMLEYYHHNLKVLNHIIPFCFTSGLNYQIFYYYRDLAGLENGEGVLFPYYAVLSSRVVLFSADMERAVNVTDPVLVRQFEECFLKEIKRLEPLILYYEEINDIFLHLLEEDTGVKNRYFLEYQPCFAVWLEPEEVRRIARPGLENAECLFHGLSKRLGQLKGKYEAFHYFTEAGLKEFAETGICQDFPMEYVRPFEEEERILILERLREYCEHGAGEIGIIKEEYLQLTRMLSACMSDVCGLNLILYDKNKGFRYLFIREKTIRNTFEDFILNMKETGMVHTREKTAELIKMCQKRLEREIERRATQGGTR